MQKIWGHGGVELLALDIKELKWDKGQPIRSLFSGEMSVRHTRDATGTRATGVPGMQEV